MPRTHPPYAPEYRRRIIELARAGRPIAQLAREFEALCCRRSVAISWLLYSSFAP